MTAVFRSCLPRFYSNINQSISSERFLHRTSSIISLHDETMDCSSIATNENIIQPRTTTVPPLNSSSSSDNELIHENTIEQKQVKLSRLKHGTNTKKRGPCYSRIDEKSPPLLTRLVETIFGDYGPNHDHQNLVKSSKRKRTNAHEKRSVLPSKSTIKKQFEDNEQTLRSLVTLLTQIESNVKLTTTQTSSKANEDQQNNLLSVDQEQARNNNRLDETSSSQSNDSYQHKSKGRSTHQHSSTAKRSTKKHPTNKRKPSEDDTLSSSSITSQSLSQSSPILRRKMVDNQQQTQLYPTKTNMGTSTQPNDAIIAEPSWLDVMREDQTTINAWARIRRRLKPNQQKDILRALMIICANLFEVPIENKHI